MKNCFDEIGRTIEPEKRKGIIWSIVTVAKVLMENGDGEQTMSPKVDFPRRAKCDVENGNMRCQFGQIDEECWPNRITEKVGRV